MLYLAVKKRLKKDMRLISILDVNNYSADITIHKIKSIIILMFTMGSFSKQFPAIKPFTVQKNPVR